MRPRSGPVSSVGPGDVFVDVLFTRGPVGVEFSRRSPFLRARFGQKALTLSARGVEMGAAETGVTTEGNASAVHRLLFA